MTAVDLSTFRPATDLLIGSLRETLGQIAEHEHPQRGGDLFCLNLTSYMGERMGPVLRRLADEQAETRKWRERHTALADEFTAEVERLRAELTALTAAALDGEPGPGVDMVRDREGDVWRRDGGYWRCRDVHDDDLGPPTPWAVVEDVWGPLFIEPKPAGQ